MPCHLLPHQRQEFEYWFTPPPFPWAAVCGSEVMRWWHVLRESDDEILLHHGCGAGARLRRVGDRIVEVELIEGEAARVLLASC